MARILGISAFYHDSAAALVVDGRIVAAAQEERFTRQKHTPDFPAEAIRYCLQESGLRIDDLDAVVFYDKPFLKFERLLETYYAFAPRGLVSFLKAIPVWIHEKLFLKKLIRDGLADVQEYDRDKLKLLFSEHHRSHAASAFYPSPFDAAAVLTIDGVGEWATASIGAGEGNSLRLIKELHFPHSVGLLYSAFTYYLGFTVNSGEYKLMGLAPYGNPEAEETRRFRELITRHLVRVYDDGSVWLDQQFFRYATGLRMADDPKWEKLFGFPRREPESEIGQSHANLALAIQQVTEDIVLKMAAEAKRLTGMDRICLAGGVALNCVANGKLLRSGLFREIFVQPAAGDAGGALGAALDAEYRYFGTERQPQQPDALQGSYLGPYYSDKEVVQMARKFGAAFEAVGDPEALCSRVAAALAEGQVVGWFQGRMEFGPRALGNRSILADARNPEMQKKLNLKIKYREGFRPFAPAVPAEFAGDYFDLDRPSPYMLFVAPVRADRRKPLPAGYADMDFWDKLYFERSDIQSVTHLDFSARVQTVHEETNPRFHRLLSRFGELSGCPVLVNTSFNVRGEPVVCTPEDAYRCFMATEMDMLVIGDHVFVKAEQPDAQDRARWQQRFKLD